MPNTNQITYQLNERELEIIHLLGEGLTNREIADHLFLAPSTVKWYIRQINSKLHTSNRDEIAAKIEQLGLSNADTPKSDPVRPRQNLPRQTTAFVGRDTELDEIHHLIEKETTQLLTILAPGGMGKTRIALESAEQQINKFADGVYFVGLQPLTASDQIPLQLANSMSFQVDEKNPGIESQVLDFLVDKHLLLVMDNWEHLLSGVPFANKILKTAPNVKIIATSREKLNLLGETVYTLRGMDFPDWETPDDALRYDAVQLLVQTAQRIQPGWELTANNLDYVARVCRLTQGMPLAILLAMSWLDVLSLERICDEIQKSISFLESDMRDVPERQQSIRGIFDYAIQQLSPEEQTQFLKTSVFRGGFTIEAAQAITGVNLRGLQKWVNKALVQRDANGRYGLHELLRQYLAQELEVSGLATSVHNTHLIYYAEICRSYMPAIITDQALVIATQIEKEFDNLRKAWVRAIETRNLDVIEDFLHPHYHLLSIKSQYHQDFLLLCESVFSGLQSHKNTPVYRKVQNRWFAIQNLIRDTGLSEAILLENIEFFREADDKREVGFALHILAHYKVSLGEHQAAIGLNHEALEIFTELGHHFGIAHSNHLIGYSHSSLGMGDEGYVYTQRAYEAYEKIGYQLGISTSLTNLAANLHSKDAVQSESYARRALAIRREMGANGGIAWSLAQLSIYHIDRGEKEEAGKILLEALAFAEAAANKESIIIASLRYARLLMHIGHDQAALDLSQKTSRIATRLGHADMIEYTGLLLGTSLIRTGQYDEGVQHLQQQLHIMKMILGQREWLGYIINLLPLLNARWQPEQVTAWISHITNHPDREGWIAYDVTLQQTIDNLKNTLGADDFASAWEQGRTLDTETVIQTVIAELEP